MRILFWISVLGVTYSYALYPLILLFLPKRKQVQTTSQQSLPTVSIIITAHNEEARIEQKLENTLEITYPRHLTEIIVASDASSDRTDEIVRMYHAKGIRLVRADKRRGKEYAQLSALRAATGEILVFTDVSTMVGPEGVLKIATRFSDPRVGAVSSVDRFMTKDGGIAGEGLFVKYEMWLRRLESSVNTLIGLSGSFFAARRHVCEEWDTESPSDFITALNCHGLGYVAVSDSEVIGYYQDVNDELNEYRRKVRTVIRGITALSRHRAVLNPIACGLFSFQMWSHKIFRWLVPWFLLLLIIASIALATENIFYLSANIAQVCLYTAAAGAGLFTSLRKNALARFAFFFALVNVAAMHATVAFLAGKRVTTWTPTER